MIHELTGIPFVSVQLSNFGGTGSPALQQASAALINPFRASLGLPPLRNPLTIDANSPQLALYAISSHILPRPADWPSHYHLTGYFFLDDARETVEPALEAFIAAGERPVVITFGSMAGENPEKMLHLFLEAVQLSGCRAVIQQNWHGRAIPALPPTVYLADYVPHTWLLPKASCIVHHGGGGTAGAVFRSGVPSVFVPHGQIFDQFYFALLAEEAGCAGPALPYTELTAERLAKAIVNTRRTPRYYESAAALGEKIQAERGVQKARALVEALVERIGLSGQAAEQTSDSQQRTSKINQRKKFQQEQRAKRSHYDEYKNDL
jgi:sterol 3beta-glucosyltransferase